MEGEDLPKTLWGATTIKKYQPHMRREGSEIALENNDQDDDFKRTLVPTNPRFLSSTVSRADGGCSKRRCGKMDQIFRRLSNRKSTETYRNIAKGTCLQNKD